MDSFLNPVLLRPDTIASLDEIRTGAPNPLYAASPQAADELFRRYIKPLVQGTGMTDLSVLHYGWFLRELGRTWRAKNGRELAFHLELCIRKWINLGLEPNTVQFLVTEVHERIKAEAAARGLCAAGRGHDPIPSLESGSCPQPAPAASAPNT